MISEEVEKRWWAFFGHTLRHGGPAKQAMEKYEETEARRKRRKGRPKHNFAYVVKKDLEKKGCEKDDHLDRKKWKDNKDKTPRRKEKTQKDNLKRGFCVLAINQSISLTLFTEAVHSFYKKSLCLLTAFNG